MRKFGKLLAKFEGVDFQQIRETSTTQEYCKLDVNKNAFTCSQVYLKNKSFSITLKYDYLK